jgi:peptidyl-prolyl cis-trans isomerase SurA
VSRRIALLISTCMAAVAMSAAPIAAQDGAPADAPPAQNAAEEPAPAAEAGTQEGVQDAASADEAAEADETPAAGEVETVLISAVGDPNTQAVASIVNDYVISEYDVSQRLALALVTSGIQQPSPEVLDQVREQVLTSLQDETLQLQEAAEQEITIQAQEIEDSIRSVADENGFEIAAIERTLATAGVAMTTFRRQIAAQIAWNRLIESRYAGAVNISEEDVDAALERLQTGADRPQFLVSEIFLSVDGPQDEAPTRESAEQIISQLAQGAQFANVARQFSQSASAASGGDIGWVLQGQLPEEIDEVISEMDPGRLAGPIRSEGGYYIFVLRDRREPIGTEAVEAPVIDPNAPVPLERLLLPMPPNPTEEMQIRARDAASMAVSSIATCEDIPAVAAQLEGAIHMSLGEVNLNTLSPEISQHVRNTPPGNVVPPFGSQVGVEIFVRCDERIRERIPIEIPTREAMAQQLYLQQMTVLARSYMRDLRREAVIEIR